MSSGGGGWRQKRGGVKNLKMGGNIRGLHKIGGRREVRAPLPLFCLINNYCYNKEVLL